MFSRVLLIASLALMIQVISEVNGQQTGKLSELAIKAREEANAKSRAVQYIVEELKEALRNVNEKQIAYYEAIDNKSNVIQEKIDVNVELTQLDYDVRTAEDTNRRAPTSKTKGDITIATNKLNEAKNKTKELDAKLTEARNNYDAAKQALEDAKKNAEVFNKKSEELIREAERAEIHATEIEAIAGNSNLQTSFTLNKPGGNGGDISSLIQTTPKPNSSTLSPEETVALWKALMKAMKKTEPKARRPTILGDVLRFLSKFNSRIADSLDQLKASFKGIIRPITNRN